MLNLDTHMFVELLRGDLSEGESKLVVREKLAASDIVPWKLAKLVPIGRLTILPISIEIARSSTELDFTSDPAHEIIAATSLVEEIPLLTRDRRILKSRMVPFTAV